MNPFSLLRWTNQMHGNAGRKQPINQPDCQNAEKKQDCEKCLYIIGEKNDGSSECQFFSC